jgi:hypothetical protein
LPYCISCCAQPWRIYKHAICGHLRVVERLNLFFFTWYQRPSTPPSSSTLAFMAGSSSSGGGFNILSHQVHEKLTLDNFLIWKAQVLPAVRGAQLIEFLQGTKVKPDEFITIDKPDKSKERVPNPACTTWLRCAAVKLPCLHHVQGSAGAGGHMRHIC